MKTIAKTKTKPNRRLALFTAILMALTLWTALPLAASADETDSSTQLTYTVSEENATITGYTGEDKATMTSIEIPATVGASIPVTSISRNAFDSCTALTNITLALGQVKGVR
jgi:hypothetical protein